MRNKIVMMLAGVMLLGLVIGCSNIDGKVVVEYKEPYDVEALYNEDQPQVKVLEGAYANFAKAPADAVVLFNGTDLENWSDGEKNPTKWIVKDGAMESVKDVGYIYSKQKFGSVQLHLEFATPSEVTGNSQGRGNSGVYLMSKYEIQILDSYENRTYPVGSAAAVYGMSPPFVNVSLPPGEWQSYDIVFHRPIFDGDKVLKPATVTVFHNGVLVQENFEIMGATVWKKEATYKPHEEKLPLSLQEHGNPVRFRNVWVREIADKE